MSKATTIHTNLVTLLTTALSTYSRLPNPYAPSQNPLNFARGLGVAIGAGSGRQLNTGTYRFDRTYTVVLMNLMTAMEFDASGRASLETALVEDFYTVLRTIEGDNQLSGQAVKVDYVSDTGVQALAGEAARYLTISINFTVLYTEQL